VIKTLEPILGRSNVDALIYELENDLPLANRHEECNLAEIQSALEKIFGRDQVAAAGALRKVCLKLNRDELMTKCVSGFIPCIAIRIEKGEIAVYVI
jgi:hypothetical protein